MKLKLKVTFAAIALCLIGFQAANAQEKPKDEKKWYDTFTIRGYLQARYNRLLETNSQLKCEQCDRSWGENGGFFLRRARVVFSGQIGKQVYFYLQPDFASSASSTSLNFGQIRDAYFDIGLDQKNEFRFRVGQSKIPFGSFKPNRCALLSNALLRCFSQIFKLSSPPTVLSKS